MNKLFSCAISYSEVNNYTIVLESYYLVDNQKITIESIVKVKLTIEECLKIQSDFYSK
jgi:hypothetical protein